MDTISVSDLDLLTFFECEPKLLDADIPWVYNDAVYEYSSGSLSISFAIAPSYKDVRVIFKGDWQILYELNATGVTDVRYHKDGDRESLEVLLNDTDRLWLRLKPTITISQEVKE